MRPVRVHRERPIRVHRVVTRMNVGGPAFHVSYLSRALGDEFRTTLVTGAPGPGEEDMTDFARRSGVDVRVIPELRPVVDPAADARALWRLYRLFRREAPDIVHTHTAKAGAVGRVAACLARVPVRIHTFHGHVLGGRYFTPRVTEAFRQVERILATGTHRIVVLADRQRRELANDLGVAPPAAFHVIPLGLDLGSFRRRAFPRGKADARAALGLPADSLVVCAVGRLVPIKRHDVLLHALAALTAAGGRDWRLVVVGGGPDAEEMRRLADRLGLSARVCWLGWQEDVASILEGCDVLAQTSDDEGTPVAVIEALALGLPVVATDVGGVREVLDGAPGTRTVPAGSPEAVAAALASTLAEQDRVPDRVRDEVVRRFSVERLAADIADLYRSELARAGLSV